MIHLSKMSKPTLVNAVAKLRAYSGILEAKMDLEIQKLMNQSIRDEIAQKVEEQFARELNLHQAILNAQFNAN